MLFDSKFESVRQMFADQFESDGTGYLYRKGMKGAPIRVTKAERDGFVADFNRRLRLSFWSIFPATIALIAAFAWLGPDVATSQAAIWLGLALVLAPYVALHLRAYYAPARALQRRTPEGRERSRQEMRRLTLGRITYGQLGLAAVMGVFLAWNASGDTDIFHGWGVLWLIFAASLVLLSAIQAFRKWRQDRL